LYYAWHSPLLKRLLRVVIARNIGADELALEQAGQQIFLDLGRLRAAGLQQLKCAARSWIN
jgi:hypothetical protein